MLLRLTALKGSDPRSDVVQIRDELEPFIPEVCILDAITARIMEILDGEVTVIEPLLDSLLEEVREAESELAEQLSSLFNPNDHVLVIAEREGGFIEASLKDAAEAIHEEDNSKQLSVTIISVMPDHEGLGKSMAARLKGAKALSVDVFEDSYVTYALQKCNKVLLPALAVDMKDGGVCPLGSAIICCAANRMRVPTVLAFPKHRMVPVLSGSVHVMTRYTLSPGKLWAYDEARDDRVRDAITVVSLAYDLVPVQKCEMIVTEFGGYAPEYAKSLAPKFETPADEGQSK